MRRYTCRTMMPAVGPKPGTPNGKTMKTIHRNHCYGSTLHFLLALLLLLSRAAAWWLPDARAKIVGSDSRIKVVGTLPPRDFAAIQRLVRYEKWRGVSLPQSWLGIRMLPATIRARWLERIASITVNADGSVGISTAVSVTHISGVTTNCGCGGSQEYKLKKAAKDWQIFKGATWGNWSHCTVNTIYWAGRFEVTSERHGEATVPDH